jgi:hypothetical protein
LDDRAQGAFEYILLLAGVLLIVVLVIIILRNTVLTGTVGTQINSTLNTWANLTNVSNI